MKTFEEIQAAALALPADEREKLYYKLLSTLDTLEDEDESWGAEIDRRVEAVHRGEPTIPAEEAFKLAHQALLKVEK